MAVASRCFSGRRGGGGGGGGGRGGGASAHSQFPYEYHAQFNAHFSLLN